MKTSADKCAAAGCYAAGISQKTITGLATALQAVLNNPAAKAALTPKQYDSAVLALRNCGIAAETRSGK